MDWIKYTDRVPAIGETFTARIHIKGEKPEVKAVRCEEWEGLKNIPWFRSGAMFFGLESSDAWMPLPAPPEE